MEFVNDLWNIKIFDNTILQYSIAILVFIISYFILSNLKKHLFNFLKQIADKTKIQYDDYLYQSLEEIKPALILWLSIYISISFLTIPQIIKDIVEAINIIIAVFYISNVIAKFISLIIKDLNNRSEDKIDENIIDLIILILRLIMLSLAVLMILSNLGINITALLAGLGIGGLAIAFALQKIMEDIFAFFVIHLDKPFKKGEFIAFGQYRGNIKKIGIKSTRIASITGEEIIVSNKDLLNTVISNYGRIESRTEIIKIGVSYETPAEVLRRIPSILTEIVKSVSDQIEIKRVNFRSFGDYSLIFELVITIPISDFKTYLSIIEEINLKIKETFDKEGIRIAFPTQEIYLRK